MRKARSQGYRSRAAFKLIEINTRDRLLIPGAKVVDLGAAPGGWSQVAAETVGPGGKVVALDLLEIAPISGVTLLRGDFRDPEIQGRLAAAHGGEKSDVVLSDMSPNISGIAAADQARTAELICSAIEFCRTRLKRDGALLVKVFQGGEFAGVLRRMKQEFRDVQVRKPRASRGESRETYLLARGLKGIQ